MYRKRGTLAYMFRGNVLFNFEVVGAKQLLCVFIAEGGRAGCVALGMSNNKYSQGVSDLATSNNVCSEVCQTPLSVRTVGVRMCRTPLRRLHATNVCLNVCRTPLRVGHYLEPVLKCIESLYMLKMN